MNKKEVEEVALRSGLTVAVATALLNAGYAYVEHIKAQPTWVRESYLKKV